MFRSAVSPSVVRVFQRANTSTPSRGPRQLAWPLHNLKSFVYWSRLQLWRLSVTMKAAPSELRKRTRPVRGPGLQHRGLGIRFILPRMPGAPREPGLIRLGERISLSATRRVAKKPEISFSDLRCLGVPSVRDVLLFCLKKMLTTKKPRKDLKAGANRPLFSLHLGVITFLPFPESLARRHETTVKN